MPSARALCPSYSASVVIPSYNMGWCISRAVISCQRQSMPVHEIIVVDDCSTDNTEKLVQDLATRDPRIKYFRNAKNEGHLRALGFGLERATSEWVALLDADDELTYLSIEARIRAALEYQKTTGITPQLSYGDHFQVSETSGKIRHTRFVRFNGYAYDFVTKELCLCQTSTIMLGKNCVKLFPRSTNKWTTDDLIVLAIAKEFPLVHCGQIVAVYHKHASTSRMSNDPKRRFHGIRDLVRVNHGEILRIHGIFVLLLWHLRLLKAFLDYKIEIEDQRKGFGNKFVRSILYGARNRLSTFLTKHFTLNYF